MMPAFKATKTSACSLIPRVFALRKSIDDRHSNCYKKYMSPKQIVAIRKALGMTQSQLAERIAAHRVSVARWETGRNQPKGAYLKALNELAAKIKTNR